MTGAAASHFPNSPKLLEAFLERFGRIIYSYRTSGTKGQSMIAKMLNRNGYRTYRRDLWTMSLVGNLLNLLSPRKKCREPVGGELSGHVAAFPPKSSNHMIDDLGIPIRSCQISIRSKCAAI